MATPTIIVLQPTLNPYTHEATGFWSVHRHESAGEYIDATGKRFEEACMELAVSGLVPASPSRTVWVRLTR